MTENIWEFLRQFDAEELADRGVLQGSNNSLRGPSIDPLIALMREHGVDKLEFPKQEWFLDLDGNFNNPQSRQNARNVSQLKQRGAVFTKLNRFLNPHQLPWPRHSSNDLIVQDDEDEAVGNEARTDTFGLERDLQSALRENIEELKMGLKITDGGSERKVEAGWIDITAEDVEGKSVVIELKTGTAPPGSLTQILAYMASLEAEEHEAVRGILIAGDFDRRVILATRAVSALQLRRYSFSFTFSEP